MTQPAPVVRVHVLSILGRIADARRAWEEALEIAEGLQVPEAGELRARLTALEP